MFSNLPDLLTVSQARSALQIGKNKMLELLAEGQIEGAFKLGRTWRIPKTSIVQYIYQH